MNITVESLPQYRIAYVRQVGPYGPANTQAMEKLKQWASERNLLTETAILLGIPQDNPQTTRPEDCRYDACIVISEDYHVDGSINVSETISGEYAICKIVHTAEEIQKGWSKIHQHLQINGYQMANQPIVERYMFSEMLSNNLCEICVPIIL